MANFRKIAVRLGLADLDKNFPGQQECKECGEKLRLGRDGKMYEHVYCPRCEKIVYTAFTPKFPSKVKLDPCDD